MQHQDDLNSAQREFEAALRCLSPAPPRVDAIQAAFVAGQRLALRRARAVHSAIAGALVIAMGWWFWRSPEQPPLEHPVSVAASLVPIPADQSMIILRRAALQNGLDKLPEAPLPAAHPLRMNDLL
jgi:hypothetical protein